MSDTNSKEPKLLWLGDDDPGIVDPDEIYLDYSFSKWAESQSVEDLDRYLTWKRSCQLWNRKRSKIARAVLTPFVAPVWHLLRFFDFYDSAENLSKAAVWATCFGKMPELDSSLTVEVYPVWHVYKTFDFVKYPYRKPYHITPRVFASRYFLDHV
jgi:hypothetical protein